MVSQTLPMTPLWKSLRLVGERDTRGVEGYPHKRLLSSHRTEERLLAPCSKIDWSLAPEDEHLASVVCAHVSPTSARDKGSDAASQVTAQLSWMVPFITQ